MNWIHNTAGVVSVLVVMGIVVVCGVLWGLGGFDGRRSRVE